MDNRHSNEMGDRLKYYMEIGKLKELDRKGWVIRNIAKPESVAGHMYRMAMIAMTLNLERGVDLNKIIKLCLVHDVAECIVGDITPHDKVPVDIKHQLETDAVVTLSNYLPKPFGDELYTLYKEYENQETLEANITKDLDRLDMLIQAHEYEKREHDAKRQVPDLEEFFTTTVTVFKNDQVKEVFAELVRQRNQFHAAVQNGVQ